MAMDSRQLLPKGTVLDGKYRIERVIGAGGFGITYAAHDIGLSTTVALKEYFPGDFGARDKSLSVRPRSDHDRELFERLRVSFVREARTLAKFKHPSIVRVLSVFEAHGTAYMVMEFEDGRSLKGWLDHLDGLPTQEELDRIVEPLLEAMEVLHDAEFLHRDIAPDNVIVRADGTPVLLDFGAARRVLVEASTMMTGIVKMGYSPQEQYATDGKLQGPWTDIYALGATLYHSITGFAPTESTSRFLEDSMVPAVIIGRGNYREGFLAGIDAAMSVRPKDRPQTIDELRQMLFAGTVVAQLPDRRRSGVRSEPRSRTSSVRAPTAAIAAASRDRVNHLEPPAQPPLEAGSRTRWGAVALGVSILALGGGLYMVNAGIGPFNDRPRNILRVEEPGRVNSKSPPSLGIRLELPGTTQEPPRADLERPAMPDPPRPPGNRNQAADQAYRDALRHLNGDGVVRDDVRARALLETAAAEGLAEAMVWLGRLHADGRGGPQSWTKAREWYEKGAAIGNATALAELGIIFLNGRGVARDFVKAREWFERAAAGGNAPAMNHLGLIYQNAQGVAQDYAKAREWFEKGVAGNNNASMNNLGWLYQNGLGVPENAVKAREWYAMAAAAGNVTGMNNIGWLLYNGRGGPVDLVKAREWFEKSVAAGNGVGLLYYGYMHQAGRGVPRDHARARELFEQASAKGERAATHQLGLAYLNGTSVPKDEARARELFEQAANDGHAPSMTSLGLLHQLGTGVPQNYALARQWFERSAAANNAQAMNQLGLLYQNGWGVERDFVKAREFYEKGASGGNTVAMHNLGLVYHFARGVAQDYAKAREWFEKAGVASDGNAMYWLGWYFQNGLGVQRDHAKALEWYTKGASNGSAPSMSSIGVLHENALGVPKDLAKAREWYERGAANGNGAGMVQLGLLFANGSGVTKDEVKAREWFEKAVAANNDNGAFQLAQQLDRARGGAVDHPRAAQLLLRALQAGNQSAIRDLDGAMANWNRLTRIEIKRELQKAGRFTGALTDVWDDAVKQAITAHRAAVRPS